MVHFDAKILFMNGLRLGLISLSLQSSIELTNVGVKKSLKRSEKVSLNYPFYLHKILLSYLNSLRHGFMNSITTLVLLKHFSCSLIALEMQTKIIFQEKDPSLIIFKVELMSVEE